MDSPDRDAGSECILNHWYFRVLALLQQLRGSIISGWNFEFPFSSTIMLSFQTSIVMLSDFGRLVHYLCQYISRIQIAKRLLPKHTVQGSFTQICSLVHSDGWFEQKPQWGEHRQVDLTSVHFYYVHQGYYTKFSTVPVSVTQWHQPKHDYHEFFFETFHSCCDFYLKADKQRGRAMRAWDKLPFSSRNSAWLQEVSHCHECD